MENKGLEFEECILEFERKLVELKEIASSFNTDLSAEIKAVEKQLLKEKKLFYSSLTPWQRVLISRDSLRPRSSDYINELLTNRVELSGDRIHGDDPAIIGGLATFRGYKVVFLGQEKGRDT